MQREKACLVSILAVHGIGPKKVHLLKERLGSFQAAWQAPAETLTDMLGHDLGTALIAFRNSTDPEQEFKAIAAHGYSLVAEFEPEYPSALKNIPSPPPLLFCHGQMEALAEPCIAIVGSRKATPYGRKVARMLGKELAEAGFVVVSGMARGIDAEAHWGCLEGGGVTAGILGNGLDIVYPKDNLQLYNRVRQTGLLVSEFFPGTAPDPKHFPQRNRIIAGLARGLVVVEAQEKSGAMITVDFALEQGKDVFAVPGPITGEMSKGPNNLIRQGAMLVTSVHDILEEWNLCIDKCKDSANNGLETETRFASFNSIGVEPVHIDELLRQTGMSFGDLASQLLQLEIDGRIKSLPGSFYVRI
ncbi:MAG: DNA-processing protein DprA [Ignavibacteriales bacterium]